jgi:hypothetical protein
MAAHPPTHREIVWCFSRNNLNSETRYEDGAFAQPIGMGRNRSFGCFDARPAASVFERRLVVRYRAHVGSMPTLVHDFEICGRVSLVLRLIRKLEAVG